MSPHENNGAFHTVLITKPQEMHWDWSRSPILSRWQEPAGEGLFPLPQLAHCSTVSTLPRRLATLDGDKRTATIGRQMSDRKTKAKAG